MSDMILHCLATCDSVVLGMQQLTMMNETVIIIIDLIIDRSMIRQ